MMAAGWFCRRKGFLHPGFLGLVAASGSAEALYSDLLLEDMEC